jgi:hypothetical protein
MPFQAGGRFRPPAIAAWCDACTCFQASAPAGSWPCIRASDVRTGRDLRPGQHAKAAEGLGGPQDHGVGGAQELASGSRTHVTRRDGYGDGRSRGKGMSVSRFVMLIV